MARSIQPKIPEISVQNSMDRFGPTGKASKKLDRSEILVEWIAPFLPSLGFNYILRTKISEK